jgi:hypothetical protein
MSEKRNSILCPRCRKLISRDEAACPYCGIKRPGRRLPDIFQRWSATPGANTILDVQCIFGSVMYSGYAPGNGSACDVHG